MDSSGSLWVPFMMFLPFILGAVTAMASAMTDTKRRWGRWLFAVIGVFTLHLPLGMAFADPGLFARLLPFTWLLSLVALLVGLVPLALADRWAVRIPAWLALFAAVQPLVLVML